MKDYKLFNCLCQVIFVLETGIIVPSREHSSNRSRFLRERNILLSVVQLLDLILLLAAVL